MPVAPRTPTFSFFWDICSSDCGGFGTRKWARNINTERGAPQRPLDRRFSSTAPPPAPRGEAGRGASVEDFFQAEPLRRGGGAGFPAVPRGEERGQGAGRTLALPDLDEGPD